MSTIITPGRNPPPHSPEERGAVTEQAAGTAPRMPSSGGLIRRFSGLGFLALGGVAWWWLATHHFGGVADHAGHADQAGHAGVADGNRPGDAAAGGGGAAGIPTLVTLPAAAQKAAEIGLAPADIRPLREHLTVPGRIDYDARYRLDYASPVDGIVSRVLVKVRQKVAKGDALAELSSPDVGMARDEVRRREDDRLIEKKAADWATTIADNVESLLDTLVGQPPLAAIEKQFQDRVLGMYREKILGAYSRLIYVEKVSAGTKSLGEGGVLSGRIIDERASNLEVAKANFTAACEEARFLTRQDRDRARAALEQANRLVQISRENLRTLVGSRLEGDPAGEEAGESPGDSSSLSSLLLRTPFDGVVEDVFIARGERARVGDRLFVVADTSVLWVRAQIHERQWTAVEVSAGQSVRVVVPGADVHETTAVVNHVGATVEADSRSVPLVAELTNNDAHYKPGMFVWVDLPQGDLRDVLAVPTSAVMRHEGKSFVFVPDGAERFRRVGVTTGIESGDFVEVTRGLTVGQQVVSRGAFVLKSELLLEKETE
ncbi:MAG: efflux RND transporter periplasmic adaptor subunit [Planctomycetia bacterium]|nr:efflux RND transporter periplasmic adaptor subunit [Planctomycetia bacterium]